MAGMEAADKAIGPAIGLKVSAGDKLHMETWVRYEEKVSYEGLDLAGLASMLGGTFTNVNGFEGYSQAETTSSLLGAFNAAAYPDGSDVTRPNAYLNYIVYDDQMVYRDAGWIRVGEDAGFEPGSEGLPDSRLHKRLKFSSPVEIDEDGYIYIWVSNQSEATRVWFDDLRVWHTRHLVTQATDYGAWGEVMREQKTDESRYRYGYQGQFAEKDEETGWSHFELREYDAVIGRWLVPDPYRQHWSPYLAMGNNPTNRVDPDGGTDGQCTGDCNYDPLKDPSYHPEFEVVIHGKQWTDSDTRTLQEFVDAMNEFGGWLERTMNLPKGKGIMFYATNGGGTPYHVRSGSATHSMVDPAKVLIVFNSKAKGPYPKGYSPAKMNAASKIIEAVERAQNVYDAYDKVNELYGAGQKAVEAINMLVNRSVHGPIDSVKFEVVERVRGEKGRSARRRVYPNSEVLDTVNIDVMDY